MFNLQQTCNLCRELIPKGKPYGVLSFQIETLDSTPEHPNGIVTVHHAESVNIMCLKCTKKYNGQNLKQLLD